MQPLSKTIYEKYQVRKTRAQKNDFIELMKNRYPALCVEEAGGRKSRNLILGNIQNANIILTAHYDTVAQSIMPNIVMPYRKGLRFLYALVTILPFILIGLAVYDLAAFFSLSQTARLLLFLAVYYALFFGKFYLGKPNPNNANDNTSGVITLIEAWEKLSEEERAQTAIIFFDHEEYGCIGSKAFFHLHRKEMENKLLLNFDCVGDGNTFLFVCPNDLSNARLSLLKDALCENEMKRVVFDNRKNADHSSDHKHFPVGIAVSAMNESKRLGLHFSRIHTKNDTVLDETNIEFLSERIKNLIFEMNRSPRNKKQTG